MIESSVISELVTGLGVGGAIAVVVFFFYRRDRKDAEKKCESYADQLRQDRVFMEDRLTGIIKDDRESREKHTEALKELTTTLNRMNGRKN